MKQCLGSLIVGMENRSLGHEPLIDEAQSTHSGTMRTERRSTRGRARIRS